MGLREGVIRFESEFMNALSTYVDSAAIGLENAMKEKKYATQPWVDRTNMARTSLSAKPSQTLIGFVIKLSHGVEYGVYLELAHEQKYAVIKPTIRAEAPRIMRIFRGMIDKMEIPENPGESGGRQ